MLGVASCCKWRGGRDDCACVCACSFLQKDTNKGLRNIFGPTTWIKKTKCICTRLGYKHYYIKGRLPNWHQILSANIKTSSVGEIFGQQASVWTLLNEVYLPPLRMWWLIALDHLKGFSAVSILAACHTSAKWISLRFYVSAKSVQVNAGAWKETAKPQALCIYVALFNNNTIID